MPGVGTVLVILRREAMIVSVLARGLNAGASDILYPWHGAQDINTILRPNLPMSLGSRSVLLQFRGVKEQRPVSTC